MKITNTIKVMKQINPEVIILFKIGEFYYEYGKDSYIISYLFSYKLKKLENNIPFSAFPKSALYKVLTKLEKEGISYIIVDKSLNYEVIEKELSKVNKYIETYNKAHKYILNKNKIDNIYAYLIKNVYKQDIKNKIKKIEEILYEKWKI